MGSHSASSLPPASLHLSTALVAPVEVWKEVKGTSRLELFWTRGRCLSNPLLPSAGVQPSGLLVMNVPQYNT